MIRFEIDLPREQLLKKIQLDQVHCRRPPGYNLCRYNETQLLGGEMRGKYWMANHMQGLFHQHKFERYFLYDLTEQGDATVIEGKFVYLRRDLLYPFWVPLFFVVMQAIYMLLHGEFELRDLTTLPLAYLLWMVLALWPYTAGMLLGRCSKRCRRQEQFVLDYFRRIQTVYAKAAPPVPEDGGG